jgi:iron complex transport system substrate-binding protein
VSRRTTLAALAAVTALALTACGGSTDSSAESADAGSGSADGAFPVTIPNAFGETTIESAPERVVVTGYTDVDTVLALGVTPVAFQEFATFPDATVPGLGPWAQDEPAATAGDIQVLPVAETPTVEQVLALRPDLVIAVGSGLEQEEYDQLSALVPVLARPEGSTAFLVDREAATLAIGQALGKQDQAQALLDDVDDQLSAAAQANPEFAGKTVTVVVPDTTGAGGYGVYVAGDTRVEFLRSLGFQLTDAVAALDTDTFFTTVSAEQAPLLDADLLVVPALFSLEDTKAQLEADPVFSSIPAVQAGRVLYLSPSAEGGAISYNDVLSIPFAVDGLVPQLATALAG